MIVECQFEYWF